MKIIQTKCVVYNMYKKQGPGTAIAAQGGPYTPNSFTREILKAVALEPPPAP